MNDEEAARIHANLGVCVPKRIRESQPRGSWLRRWWRGRQRKADLAHLWPEIVQLMDGNLVHAAHVFLVHAESHPAWEGIDQEEVLEMLSRDGPEITIEEWS